MLSVRARSKSMRSDSSAKRIDMCMWCIYYCIWLYGDHVSHVMSSNRFHISEKKVSNVSSIGKHEQQKTKKTHARSDCILGYAVLFIIIVIVWCWIMVHNNWSNSRINQIGCSRCCRIISADHMLMTNLMCVCRWFFVFLNRHHVNNPLTKSKEKKFMNFNNILLKKKRKQFNWSFRGLFWNFSIPKSKYKHTNTFRFTHVCTVMSSGDICCDNSIERCVTDWDAA